MSGDAGPGSESPAKPVSNEPREVSGRRLEWRQSQEVRKKLKTGLAPDEIANEMELPLDSVADLADAIQQTADPEQDDLLAEVGPDQEIRQDAHSIYWLSWKQSKSGERYPERQELIATPFNPRRVIRVEDRELFDVEFPEQFVGTYDELMNQLQAKGRLFNKYKANQALVHVFHRHRRRGVQVGRATFEAYEDEAGTLGIPDDAFPETGAQEDAWREYLAVRDYEPEAADWEAYQELATRFYRPHEVLPLAGLSAIAPFTRLLRSANYLVPATFAFSHYGGTGKSRAAQMFSEKAWGARPTSGEDLDSDWRLGDTLRSACLPLAVNEAERFSFNERGAMLKQALEQEYTTSRGKPTRGGIQRDKYLSRRVLMFTANRLPPLEPATLVRLLLLQYDDRRRSLPKQTRDQFNEHYARLRPVGPTLPRAALELYPKPARLFDAVGAHAESLGTAFDAWTDPRRPQAWALALVGLDVWEEASDGIWAAPSTDEFVRQVVEPVENASRNQELQPLALLLAFYDSWRANHQRTDAESGIPFVQGDGLMFQEVNEGPTGTAGLFVTSGFLEEFNKAYRHNLNAQIANLPALADLVNAVHGVPKPKLVNDAGQARRQTFAEGRKRAVFVPLEEGDT